MRVWRYGGLTIGSVSDAGENARMEPKMGWAALSRTRLNKAEAQLENSIEGVRDEVGVLALHTAYADRFFPGTSTQQTRLRYALFVPWQIRSLLRIKTVAVQARAELERREIQLANRLVKGGGKGVIGAQKAASGKPVTIPPSSAYWVALREWGLLNVMPHGVEPSRHDVLAHWEKWGESRAGRPQTDDEGRTLTVFPRLFLDGLPTAPKDFHGRGPLDFELGEEERRFLRARLMETTRSCDGKPSLLAQLASAEVAAKERDQLWSVRIRTKADRWDREAIDRARKAASLSAVARALYAAMVEALRERDGVNAATDRYRQHLAAVIGTHGPHAISLELDDVAADGVVLDHRLIEVLRHIQQWVVSDAKNALEPTVYRVLSDWESARKHSRSKLAKSKKGREARREWGDPDEAKPIGYRWSVVKVLLRDLAAVANGA